ncbi:hypothetical protein JCM6882_007962 [Rhodosporidiobolus microsporus]
MPRIALVQFSPLSPSPSLSSPPSSSSSPPPSSTPKDPASFDLNLQRAHAFVRQAALQGAELVVFPEYFLSGVVDHPSTWHLAQLPHSHAHLHPSSSRSQDHSAPASSPPTAQHWLSTFRSLAKELRVDIVVGTIVERAHDAEGKERWKEVEVVDEKTGEKKAERRPVLENVCHYVDWDGEVVGRYVKRNLWWPEKEYLTAGSEDHQVFNTRFGRVGLLICWDLASPLSLPSLLLHPQGAPDLIVAPTYWTALDAGPRGLQHNPESEKEYLDCLVKARAWEGECAMVFCNVAPPASWQPSDGLLGNEEGRIGLSQVCVPFKGRVGGAKGPQEELVLVDLDLSILEDARATYGVRRDLVEEKLHPERGRGEVLPGWVRKGGE